MPGGRQSQELCDLFLALGLEEAVRPELSLMLSAFEVQAPSGSSAVSGRQFRKGPNLSSRPAMWTVRSYGGPWLRSDPCSILVNLVRGPELPNRIVVAGGRMSVWPRWREGGISTYLRDDTGRGK